MSETLYRKYRPKKFDEVIGQDQIVDLLKNSLKNNNIAHAYIFAGSRGTGKTSVARIFSDALGTMEHDLYEIDAASNRGIDDIRAIKEAVHTLPFSSPKKVYIIDEAHMLTKEAWNALLKTLEEPPAHVLFILATTELEKIPDTILSRCQTFQFKKPDLDTLKNVIETTAKKEGFSLEKEASELIALSSDGSFRDAHGFLQKIISNSPDKKIDLNFVENSLGAPKESLVFDFIKALGSKDTDLGIKVLNDAKRQGIKIAFLARLILERMRHILLLSISSQYKKELTDSYSESYAEKIQKFATDANCKISSEILRETLRAVMEAEKSVIPELSLELLLIKTAGK